MAADTVTLLIMKATLYKIEQGYVLCSDDEIKEGDLCYNTSYPRDSSDKLFGNADYTAKVLIGSVWKKVLTQSPDFSELSEEDAKRIGWFDVDKMALENCKNIIPSHKEQDITTEIWISGARQVGFREGFQKHAELTSDRRFTEEDVRQIIKTARTPKMINFDGDELTGKVIRKHLTEDEIIQSLSQPKLWEVEYKEENGVYKIINTL